MIDFFLLFYYTLFFFFNDTATTEIYTSSHTLSLHDALPISRRPHHWLAANPTPDTASGRSEEHTSELQSRELISYAVFCLKKKKKKRHLHNCQIYFNINKELTLNHII